MMKPRRPAEVVPWPYPGDSELDKARWIARWYRAEVARLDPELCARLDDAASRLGQGWVTPALAVVDQHSLVTVADAADYLCVSKSAIWKWINPPAGRPKRLDATTGDDGLQRVSVGQLLDIQREQRERRIRRHTDRVS